MTFNFKFRATVVSDRFDTVPVYSPDDIAFVFIPVGTEVAVLEGPGSNTRYRTVGLIKDDEPIIGKIYKNRLNYILKTTKEDE